MGLLDGKVAIVTGGGRGLGRGVALALAGAGASVAVLGRTIETLEAASDEIRSRGGRALAVRCDVRHADEIQSAVNAPKAGKTRAHAPLKRNPLKNKAAMERLNPYAKVAAEMRAKAEAERSAAKAKKTAGARSAVGQKFYEGMRQESNYQGELFDNFATWLHGKPDDE